MANIAIILGESGSGKSTSIKNLNPEETAIISVLGKVPPFKGSAKLYNAENKNFFAVNDYSKIIKGLVYLGQQENIKNIIIDDLFFSMAQENFAKADEVGYKKFTVMAQHFQQILQTAVNLPIEKKVFLMMHSQDVVSNGEIVRKEIKLVGKFVKEGFAPEALCNIVLFCKPQYDENGIPTYGFYTHTFKDNGCEYVCKSPMGMFEEDFIPNDLNLVINAMDEYYN